MKALTLISNAVRTTQDKASGQALESSIVMFICYIEIKRCVRVGTSWREACQHWPTLLYYFRIKYCCTALNQVRAVELNISVRCLGEYLKMTLQVKCESVLFWYFLAFLWIKVGNHQCIFITLVSYSSIYRIQPGCCKCWVLYVTLLGNLRTLKPLWFCTGVQVLVLSHLDYSSVIWFPQYNTHITGLN